MANELDHEVPTPEVNEKYVNASVMFPIGKSYSRGKVIRQKRDAYWNAVGRENDNPILDTREYYVEFDNGEVRKLTENMIAESIYYACDGYGNDYLMMDLIEDYQKSNTALSVSSQKVVHRVWSFVRRSTMGW